MNLFHCGSRLPAANYVDSTVAYPTRHQRLFLVLFLLVIIAAAIWVAASWRGDDARAAPSENRREPGAVQVVTAKVAMSQDELPVDVVGSGLARQSVTIYPAVAGEVEKVLFSAGDRVKKEQLLVQLVARAERLAERLAAAEVDAARRLLKRYQATKGTGAVSASVIDEAAKNLELAEIRLAQAREALSDRSVQAPFSGVVGIAEVDPGDRVTSETVLTTLDDREVLSVAFDVPERYYGQLKQGQKVALRTVAFPDRVFEGELEKLDSRINTETRTLRVRAKVPNSKDLLRPGMSFTVRLTLPAGDYLRVPELAVQWSRDGGHVWAVRDGKAARVPVRPVRRVEGAVLVDGELRAGEAVVVEGVQRLRPGRPVEILATDNGARQG
jgi:RND family efflux transporter MFP subunit